VPFPFPFAQFVQYGLLAFQFFAPFVVLEMLTDIQSMWLACVQ